METIWTKDRAFIGVKLTLDEFNIVHSVFTKQSLDDVKKIFKTQKEIDAFYELLYEVTA